jgi:tetratricopeptide (TPR) repeat protein
LPEGGSDNGTARSLTDGAAAPVKATAVTMLLGKGQTLMKLDKPEDALGCLDEALALEPDNTDALIKKGAVLERLQRLPEAIDCYDRAIARDNTITMAYLYKGAVFNRMERYSEALECYEQALKTRQKGESADVVFQ